jgi:indoleamine 2,3-dioxygenase
LKAVLNAMSEAWDGSGGVLGMKCEEVMEVVRAQRETLEKEVEKYCQERKIEVK